MMLRTPFKESGKPPSVQTTNLCRLLDTAPTNSGVHHPDLSCVALLFPLGTAGVAEPKAIVGAFADFHNRRIQSAIHAGL